MSIPTNGAPTPVTFELLMSDRNVRWAIAAMSIFVSLGFATFVIVRIQSIDTLETENVRLKAEVIELQRRLDSEVSSAQSRILTIEQMMFGTLVPEITSDTAKKQPAPIVLSAPAQWQVQRDRELRARIAALEQWRMSQSR
jgi:hypothetical protein